MKEQQISKFIALILRHKPETIGITLDEHGWADVDALLEGINKTYSLDRAGLDHIVASDEKQRYAYSEDGTKIRANQGHSIKVDVELQELEPPVYLYHGTGKKFETSIDQEGLIAKSRLYVHLSKTIPVAISVGQRHGQPIVYRVRSGQMAKDGYSFFLSANGVWLTKHVPVRYLEKIMEK